MRDCRARAAARGGARFSIPITAASTQAIDRARARRSGRPCWCRCTASRRSMPASRGPGISARSISATPRLPPLLLQALRAEGDLVVGDNEPYAVSDAHRLHHPRAWRGARPGQHRHRDPAGPDRRPEPASAMGRAAGADFRARSKRRVRGGDLASTIAYRTKSRDGTELLRYRALCQRQPDAAADHEAAGDARHQPGAARRKERARAAGEQRVDRVRQSRERP